MFFQLEVFELQDFECSSTFVDSGQNLLASLTAFGMCGHPAPVQPAALLL